MKTLTLTSPDNVVLGRTAKEWQAGRLDSARFWAESALTSAQINLTRSKAKRKAEVRMAMRQMKIALENFIANDD